MTEVLYSESTAPIAWSEVDVAKRIYGPKGAGLAALPRAWTPPFILVPHTLTSDIWESLEQIDVQFVARVHELGAQSGKIIVRSSVIGETIWDRGKYGSVIVDTFAPDWELQLRDATRTVVNSSDNKPIALVLQAYMEPTQRGEFGNLMRISKTRDHWESSAHTGDGATSTRRLNSQRDPAASESEPLAARARLPLERLFGSLGAWLNNVLVRGHSTRLTCEWVERNGIFYVVQVDQEDEDFIGINPLQLRVERAPKPAAEPGQILCPADGAAIQMWDKLKVLEELWGEVDENRPNLFFVPVSQIPDSTNEQAVGALVDDFNNLLGPNNIVVRTSVRSNQPKALNLSRTDGLRPTEAAQWCVRRKEALRAEGTDLESLAFIAHRYISARASAWARSDPAEATVEIHGLWGLPDALQYCPYDIWEVHLPTGSATDYADYKSNMLIAQEDGSWTYVRIKNEVARALSVTRKEALDIAQKTHMIAQRLGCPCHVMWFVGCLDHDGQKYNMPWYWVHAHQTEKNEDRARHISFEVTNRESLERLARFDGKDDRYMIVLRPSRPELFRDNEFVRQVATVARERNLPVVLEGSTLAHAYYLLLDEGCTVIARGEKEHLRIRKSIPLGKIVRDKIPGRVAARRELEVTAEVPAATRLAFLIGKVLEEALEVRESPSERDRKVELADLLEIVRALAQLSGVTLNDVIDTANEKRDKLGGFDDGLVLLQTGIGGPGQTAMVASSSSAQVLSRSIGTDSIEIPFTFFGFAEVEQPRTMSFPEFGIALEVTLKTDRISLRVVREAEQLEFPLSLEIERTTSE